jgi:hypothetical protein
VYGTLAAACNAAVAAAAEAPPSDKLAAMRGLVDFESNTMKYNEYMECYLYSEDGKDNDRLVGGAPLEQITPVCRPTPVCCCNPTTPGCGPGARERWGGVEALDFCTQEAWLANCTPSSAPATRAPARLQSTRSRLRGFARAAELGAPPDSYAHKWDLLCCQVWDFKTWSAEFLSYTLYSYQVG